MDDSDGPYVNVQTVNVLKGAVGLSIPKLASLRSGLGPRFRHTTSFDTGVEKKGNLRQR